MISVPMRDGRWLQVCAMAVFLAASTSQSAVLAQGLDDPGAVDTIIGSDVQLQEGANEEVDAVIAALENTSTTIREARKKFMLDKIDIVLLPDAADASSPIGQKIEEHREEIAELRQVIQGNPMLYHAADSHSVNIGDIVALEFDDADGVKIFAAGEAALDE